MIRYEAVMIIIIIIVDNLGQVLFIYRPFFNVCECQCHLWSVTKVLFPFPSHNKKKSL